MAAVAPLVVPATAKHTATVIFIHGLGDSGHGWKPIADMFKTEMTHIKWVLPHAPTQSVTANMGMQMPSWFDIYSFGLNAEEDEEGMLKSRKSISELITAEIEAGISENRIVLGGFSQGGAMSLLTGLQPGRKLAGLAVLSGWLPLRAKFKTIASSEASTTPIFWGHGNADPLVKPQLMNKSVEYLVNELGFSVTKDTREYKPGIASNLYDGIGHTTNEKELNDLKAWLANALPK